MSGKLTNDLFTLWFQAPVVIALRCQNWAASLQSGTSNSNPELLRMVSEKLDAATESTLALNMAMMRHGATSARQFWLGPYFPFSVRRFSASLGQSTAAEGLGPYAKRVRANAKRLGRKRS
ncbi:hypothetical protein V1T76_18500 [Roseibium sp. FZY0029]|uniref:hypothetical protein n=1 Tax=Roseibium sp. FZY0029 TaxID=3116647 RepID=UPI002EC29C77|nr:hypothetical protein [Roseibium sp. FZY0029]